MANRYASTTRTRTRAGDSTPQTQAIPGREAEMTPNSAGGVVFALDRWATLLRFLILGAEGPTYYSTERKLVTENTANLRACIAEDGIRTVKTITEVSKAGRAPKNDPAVFALALCAATKDAATRKLAFHALPEVCRTGTHLFQFVTAFVANSGWSRMSRSGVANWYTGKEVEKLAYQMVKYQNREGWTHRDVLRLSHAKLRGPGYSTLFKWAMGDKEIDLLDVPILHAMQEAHASKDTAHVAALIAQHGLTREMVPSEMLNSPVVWEALLEKMPVTALVRNLGKMTEVGVLRPFSASIGSVVARITSPEQLAKARVHPLAMLTALRTYGSGHGFRGSLTWTPVAQVVDALEAGFYAAFKTIVPSGKRTMLAIDVSGSMGSGEVGGSPGLCPREAAACMAMVTARTEPAYLFFGFSHRFVELPIRATDTLDAVATKLKLPFESTDCSLPFIYAEKNKLPVDSFAVYTDNETYAGAVQPVQALQHYRNKMGIAARSAVVGLTSTGFTIADPTDVGMMDFVGFDAAAPAVMADFFRGAQPGAGTHPSE